MAAGIGQTIEASDYTTIKSKSDLIFGTNYGQTTTTPAVTASTVVTAAQWLALRTDLVKARQHQTGTTTGTTNALDGGNLLVPSSGISITDELRNQFNTFANTITTNTNVVAANQLSSESLITGSRATAWNGTLTHTVTLTGAVGGAGSAANLGYFFNAGGSIRVSAGRTGGSASSKNTTWDTMFSQMGEFVMNYTATTYTGSSAVGSAIGWVDLTTSNQLIAQKDAPAGAYSVNRYYIYARKDAGSTQVILTIQFADLDAGGPNDDENVDGTLTSQVSQYRPSGANVTVLSPTAAQSGL